MYSLVLILLAASGVYSDSHSLSYHYTGVSAPGFGLPEFSIAAYVDDQQIQKYSSDVNRTVPVAQWMKEKEGPEYWETMTNIDIQATALFRYEMDMTMNLFNHTGGFHISQVWHNCELRDDGSNVRHQWYSYDGEDYMYLDIHTGDFIPKRSEAQITAQRWNSPNVRRGDRAKVYLENCIKTLERILKYGREYLERKVHPKVKVTGQESGKVTDLHCLVYGFYPQAVDVKWMKNGIDISSYWTTHILPNPDGTYQIRVTVEVIPKEGDTYSCYVDHSSLKETLLVKWEPKQNIQLAVIIISAVVIIVLVLISVTTGVIIYRKKKDNY